MKPDAVSPRLIEAVESELLGGEELKWVGQPLRWRRAWRKAGAFVVIMALLVTAWWLATLLMAPAVLNYVPGLSLFMMAITATALMQVVIDSWRTVYAITNRRVIVIKYHFRRQVTSYGRSDLQRIERQGDRTGDIIFGETRRKSPGVYGIPQETRTQEGLFCIPNVREVEALLLETFQPADSLNEKIQRLSEPEQDTEEDMSQSRDMQHGQINR